MPRPRGQQPTPTEEKIRRGNPGRRPLPAPGAITTIPRTRYIPEPMRPLGIPGRELWERVWRAGATWLLDSVDSETLLVVCEQMDERQNLRMVVMRDANWRDRAALRAMDKQVVYNLSLLGFNPVDRARLVTLEPEPSALDDFMARRAARTSG